MRLYRDRESRQLHRRGLVVWDAGERTKFADVHRARAGFDAALATHVAAGYAVGPDELVDIEARRVLADAQIERGDPLGQIFALQDAMRPGRPADPALAAELDALVAAVHEPLLGALAPHVDIIWQGGLATDVTLRAPGRYGELCTSPIATHVRRLRVLGFPDLRDVEPVRPVARFAAALREWGTPPHLARLEIRGAADRVESLPDISDVVSAADELAALWLEIRCAGLGGVVAPALASVYATEIDPTPLLAPGAAPALREIAVVRARGVDAFVRALAGSDALAGLTHLRLPASGVTLATLELVFAHAARFRHLEVIDLSYNDLPRAVVRDARDALPGLHIEPMTLGAGPG